MAWNDIVYGAGDLLESTFTYLPKLGNIPNVIAFAIIFLALAYWVKRLVGYHNEAKRTGERE